MVAQQPTTQRLVDLAEWLCTPYPRKRSGCEARTELSIAYVRLTASVLFARHGMVELARETYDRAVSALDLEDPIHGAFARVYDGLLAGRIFEGLPTSLDSFAQYKAEKLIEQSALISPLLWLDPIGSFYRRAQGRPDPDGAPLPRGADGATVRRAIVECASMDSEDLTRRCDRILDALLALTREEALAALESILVHLPRWSSVPDRTLVCKTVLIAAELGAMADVERLMTPLCAELGGPGRRGGFSQLRPRVWRCLEMFRRTRQKDREAELLRVLLGGPLTEADDAFCRARLGNHVPARRLLERPDASLRELWGAHRVAPFARCAAALPPDEAWTALDRIRERLSSVTDSFNTNSHYCVQLIVASEAMLLAGHVLTLGLD